MDNAGHVIDDGRVFEDGQSTNVTMAVEARYAITDRLSVATALPYVSSRFRSTAPGPAWVPKLPVDECRCWNGAFQDFAFEVRHNTVAIGRQLAVTPLAAVVLPSHRYAYKGEAVPGRRLKELHVGAAAGVRLDALSPRLFLSGRYTYGFVERVLGLRNDRSLIGLELAIAQSRRLTWLALANIQRTHGGLRAPEEISAFPDRIEEHDRLLKDDFVHLGGGVSYRWSRMTLAGTFLTYVSGRNTHVQRVYTVSLSVPFEAAARAPSYDARVQPR